jgi:hypothetical protein
MTTPLDIPATKALAEEMVRLEANTTAGDWGAFGDMVLTPPRDERLRRLREDGVPYTCKRICLCHNEAYIPQEEAEANAQFIAHCKTKPTGQLLLRLVEEVEMLRAALNGLTSFVATCRSRNTVEWMWKLESRVNAACTTLRDPDQFVYVRGGLSKLQPPVKP